MAWKTHFEGLTFIENNPARECSKCHIIKPLTDFSPDKRRTLGVQSHCKECVCNYQSNIRRTKDVIRNDNLQNLYGISLADYEILYNKQNGLCAICKKSFDKLHIDHCHTTNKIRGLLCANCNVGIGNLKENIQILINAIIYIKKHTNA